MPTQGLRNINAMVVPTGIGASIGGYAGDANPAAKLLAKASDLLITHPNVVNGAMMTDIPQNIAVVEGYHLDRFFAGQVALRNNVKHKIAVVVDSAASEEERDLTLACMRAAKHVYGVDIMDEIFYTDEDVEANDLKQIKNFRSMLRACKAAQDSGATALAILCVLDEDEESNEAKAYQTGMGYDPIGGIEARISHLAAQMTLLPCAHAPIIRTKNEKQNSQYRSFDSGVGNLAVLQKEETVKLSELDPRVTAEYLSDCFLASVIKCLQNSPQIIPLESHYKVLSSEWMDPADLKLFRKPEDIIVSQVTNLVVPYDCCNGTPMVESWKNEIQVICVESNTTNLEDTAEMHGIPHVLVKNYLEAAGFLLANTDDKNFIDPKLFIADDDSAYFSHPSEL